jgi:hypothetical protein
MKNSEKVAVCASSASDKVEKFIELSEFKSNFQKAYNNGNIQGVYRDENGKIVADDCWGNTLDDILRNS